MKQHPIHRHSIDRAVRLQSASCGASVLVNNRRHHRGRMSSSSQARIVYPVIKHTVHESGEAALQKVFPS